MDEAKVRELVGELGDDLGSVSPSQADFLVGQDWARTLVEAVFGPQGWPVASEASEIVPLESCLCGKCFHCPDGWHSDDQMPCGCTADCAVDTDRTADG